jgi:hypothetical protein
LAKVWSTCLGFRIIFGIYGFFNKNVLARFVLARPVLVVRHAQIWAGSPSKLGRSLRFPARLLVLLKAVWWHYAKRFGGYSPPLPLGCATSFGFRFLRKTSISTPPPSFASHHRQPFTYGEMSVVWWLAQPPVVGRGVAGSATLAYALQLGADCPQTPTAGKGKTAEKAVFPFPAQIFKL